MTPRVWGPGLAARLRAPAALLAIAVLAGACATRQPAPVVDRTPPPAALPPPPAPAEAPAQRTYTVKRGDTLVGIALQFGLDYRELAAWNNIENPNVIRVGQVLVLAAPGSAPVASAPRASGTVATPLRGAEPPVARPPANTETRKVEPRAQRLPYSERNLAQLSAADPPFAPPSVASVVPVPVPPGPSAAGADTPSAPGPSGPGAVAVPGTAPPPPAPAPAAAADAIDWMWPVKGRVIATFTDANKGIDIAGARGTPVLAAAAGRVVYVGQGLRGYGKLVILRHSEQWLSAYAHNDQLLVKEQQEVARGQKIAEMGSTDADQVKLHFEIRRQGRPVDPLKFLPSP